MDKKQQNKQDYPISQLPAQEEDEAMDKKSLTKKEDKKNKNEHRVDGNEKVNDHEEEK